MNLAFVCALQRRCVPRAAFRRRSSPAASGSAIATAASTRSSTPAPVANSSAPSPRSSAADGELPTGPAEGAQTTSNISCCLRETRSATFRPRWEPKMQRPLAVPSTVPAINALPLPDRPAEGNKRRDEGGRERMKLVELYKCLLRHRFRPFNQIHDGDW